MVKLIKGKKAVKKTGKEKIEYFLPQEKSVPVEDLMDYSQLIYGAKKIGKTTLTAQVDGMLALMCEPGGKALSMYQTPCKNWTELRAKTKLFIKDPRFKAVSIDTADYAYEFCMDFVCKKMVIDHPSDEGYGKGWKAVRTEFTAWVSELLHSGKGVIFISHLKDEEIKTRRNESYHKTGASMAGQAKDILEGLVDIWTCYRYEDGERMLLIGGSDELDVGHRAEGHFQYKDGTPILRIPMGSNAKEAYENFVAAFNNELDAPIKKKLVIGAKKKKR